MGPDDCASHACVPTMQGYVCAAECMTDEECEKTWICSVLPGSNGRFCLDMHSELCKPCQKDTDCVPMGAPLHATFLCINHGTEGSFCGVPCEQEMDCPDGFNCVPSSNSTKQCMPGSGTPCPCTDRYKAEGYETVCYRQNKDAICYGTKTCDSECTAREPTDEVCNNEDDDCDGEIDEDIQSHPCPITSGGLTCMGMSACIDHKEVCLGQTPSPEVCNGKDDDCDGLTDEEGALSCFIFYADRDGDGFGAKGDSRCLCNATWPYVAEFGSDCDDENSDIHPGAMEVCNGRDDDCDGQTDPEDSPECTLYFYDEDGDGFGITGKTKCLCEPSGKYSALFSGDCDDSSKATHPYADEYCNGKDDDCDGLTDEEGAIWCEPFYQDLDKDSYGNPDVSKCLCKAIAGWVKKPGDCSDNDENVHENATEFCNLKDDNCNGLTDEENAADCKLYMRDEDEDGYGVTGDQKCVCPGTKPYTVPVSTGKGGDCDDLDTLINPGVPEICTPPQGTPKDEDCDGLTDEGGDESKPSIGSAIYYKDADGDGWGAPDDFKRLCKPTGAYLISDSSKALDCCDSDAGAHPDSEMPLMDHPTACGTWDWDCDGKITMYSNANPGWCHGIPCKLDVGWFHNNPVPACGTNGQWVYECNSWCNEKFVTLTQTCK